jgi:predicted glycoside hydrolase/deacetylase ChbG (UPF0249 family)
MTRYLIVHADDLGHPDGTVEAIFAGFEAGVVTSTSAMVNQPFWPQAAAGLREHPEWDAGVHLVMNDGGPVLPPRQVRSLLDREGRFRDGGALLARYPLISHTQLRAEWRAQVEQFIADTGRTPSHLDLHCHYPYVFPAWFRLSVELAQEYGDIPVRAPFDDALEEKAPELSASYGGFPPWFVVWQGRRYKRMVDRRGLVRTNYWESSFSQDGRRTVEILLDLLDRLPEGVTELLCHPGTEGWRAQDLRSLMDPRVRERIEALAIQLTDYVALVEGLGGHDPPA